MGKGSLSSGIGVKSSRRTSGSLNRPPRLGPPPTNPSPVPLSPVPCRRRIGCTKQIDDGIWRPSAAPARGSGGRAGGGFNWTPCSEVPGLYLLPEDELFGFFLGGKGSYSILGRPKTRSMMTEEGWLVLLGGVDCPCHEASCGTLSDNPLGLESGPRPAKIANSLGSVHRLMFPFLLLPLLFAFHIPGRDENTALPHT